MSPLEKLQDPYETEDKTKRHAQLLWTLMVGVIFSILAFYLNH